MDRRLAGVLLMASALALTPMARSQAPPGLVVACASFRDRPLHPRVYFYEHDGVGQGQAAGHIEAANLLVDTRPSLANGGRLCAVASEQENQPGDVRLWDRTAKGVLADWPGLNTEVPELAPSLSAEGGYVAFAAWQRQGSPGGWNVFLYSLKERRIVDLPFSKDDDEQSPSLNGDGRLVAYVTNARDGAGLSDIRVYDRLKGRDLDLPGLNTSRRELDPALSADGRFLAFTSDRPGGVGSLDVYLYDIREHALVALPGVNGPGPDQTPALTADGRYLAFAAERVTGLGERDVYLYDRRVSRVLPTPGLNTRAEDFDPTVAILAP